MLRVLVSRLALLLSPCTLLGQIKCPNQYQQKIKLVYVPAILWILFWSFSNRMISSQFVYTRESVYKI